MKKLLLFALNISMIELHAQKNIDGMIMTEKNFAAYSVEHGTKAAFLKFLDSNGIVFDQGKPVNGLQSWNKRQDRPGILNWHPVAAEIAGSGDFGYTSGPWTFQPGLHDSVVARGTFNTVWHRIKNGEWKFLVDLGVGNTAAVADTNVSIKKSADILKKGSLKSMLQAENQFIQLMKISEQKAYENYVSIDAILERTGIVIENTNLKAGNYRLQANTNILGSGIASSLDLGYVYGITTVNGKTDNYLRVWRHEKKGWKIVLEVLRD